VAIRLSEGRSCRYLEVDPSRAVVRRSLTRSGRMTSPSCYLIGVSSAQWRSTRKWRHARHVFPWWTWKIKSLVSTCMNNAEGILMKLVAKYTTTWDISRNTSASRYANPVPTQIARPRLDINEAEHRRSDINNFHVPHAYSFQSTGSW